MQRLIINGSENLNDNNNSTANIQPASNENINKVKNETAFPIQNNNEKTKNRFLQNIHFRTISMRNIPRLKLDAQWAFCQVENPDEVELRSSPVT